MSEEATQPTSKTICDDEVDNVPTTQSQRVAEPTTVDRENTSPIKNYIYQTPEQVSTIQFENEISPVATNGNLNRPCAWQNNNEPLKDSSNSKVDRQNENDVGKSPSKIPKKDRSELKTPTRAVTPKSPENLMSIGQKRLPMNKVQVGSAPSPNLKVVRSKVGSLQNTSHKPGGGQVKIENRKLEWKAGTRIEAKNDAYVPGGGDKKIQSVKLQWNAKPKVGSLDNKTHKPGGGDKKIETVKLDFKDKAKPKIGSKDNIKHTPGGGAVKIEDQKLDIKAQSKVGSLDNVKHRPGGGEVKIFDDKSYIKQTTAGQIGTPTKTQSSRSSQAGNVAEQEI